MSESADHGGQPPSAVNAVDGVAQAAALPGEAARPVDALTDRSRSAPAVNQPLPPCSDRLAIIGDHVFCARINALVGWKHGLHRLTCERCAAAGGYDAWPDRPAVELRVLRLRLLDGRAVERRLGLNATRAYAEIVSDCRVRLERAGMIQQVWSDLAVAVRNGLPIEEAEEIVNAEMTEDVVRG